MTSDPVTPELAEIADAHGVATSYLDGSRTKQRIDAEVVRTVLGLLEVDVASPTRNAWHLPGPASAPAPGRCRRRSGCAATVPAPCRAAGG